MVLNALLDPIFGPLLVLQPWASLLILSGLISLLIVIVYKFTTDQDLMKRLKSELKEFQAEMKELRGHPEKAMEVNKKMMDTNMKYMMQSMKSTLYTMIPILLIFSWMNANLAYEPILPGQEFSVMAEVSKDYTGNVSISVPEGMTLVSSVSQAPVDREVSWTMKGITGNYLVTLEAGQEYQKEVEIANKRSYADVEEKVDGNIRSISINNDPVKPLGDVSLFGWKPGWLGVYIIFSIVFSIGLRKLFRVY